MHKSIPAIASFVVGALTLASPSPSSAQSIAPIVPLNDTNCVPAGGQTAPPFSIPSSCPVDGTRIVTRNSETAVIDFSNFSRGLFSTVTGTYTVDFTGNLHPDGLPIYSASPVQSPTILDPTVLFGATTSVGLTTRYDATLTNAQVLTSAVPAANYSYFQGYSNFRTTVNSINLSLSGTPSVSGGRTYTVDLSTPNPTALAGGNSVALAGRYNSRDSLGALVFGRLTGTATLVQNAGVTPAPDGIGGYYSPFAVQVATTSVETTRLDENGLTTPTVSVTNGINLNGSSVRNVADAVAPGDAVNLRQLQSMTGQSAATNSRLAALEGSLATIDSRLSILDRRIAAGTAIATAMSGNAFLPDMKFNLTANVATYDGAHAGAIQMGALVSRHVAVNAGVAVGFNRGGKTAARAGMTFGW